MFLFPRQKSDPQAKATIAELEASIVKKIDRLKVHCDLEEKDFRRFQTQRIYPYLRVVIKKFLDYAILKKLEDIAALCELDVVLGKISSCLANLEMKLFKSNNMHPGRGGTTRAPGQARKWEEQFRGSGEGGVSQTREKRFNLSLKKNLFGRDRGKSDNLAPVQGSLALGYCMM